MVCGWPDKIIDLAFAVSEVLKSCLTRRSGRELSCMYLLFLVSSFIPAPVIQTGTFLTVEWKLTTFTGGVKSTYCPGYNSRKRVLSWTS